MTTETRTIYLVATISSFDSKPFVFISDSPCIEGSDYVELDQKEISFEVPDVQVMNGKLIVGLKEKKAKMMAAASAAINEVEGQIQSLLALEHIDADH